MQFMPHRIFCIAPVSSQTITVENDGGEDYERIQDAINVKDGDPLRVYEETNYENVVINKSLSLMGIDLEETTIDGGGSG